MECFLETSRLIIRKPRVEDFPSFWELVNDPIAMRYTAGTSTLTYDEAENNYIKSIKSFGENNKYIFSVIDKTSNNYLDYCGNLAWRILEIFLFLIMAQEEDIILQTTKFSLYSYAKLKRTCWSIFSPTRSFLMI